MRAADTASADPGPLAPITWAVVGDHDQRVVVVDLDADAGERRRVSLAPGEFADHVVQRELASAPRWVWDDTARRSPPLLAAGVRVARSHDLRLSHRILACSADIAAPGALRAAAEWEGGPSPAVAAAAATLFELAAPTDTTGDIAATLAEFRRQRGALSTARAGSGLHLLAAAESAGALLAAEMHAAGLPWDQARHDAVLEAELGARPPSGARPSQLELLAQRLREQLDDPTLNPDSAVRLLRALHRRGIAVESTSRWELERVEHEVVPTLLEYKRLARLWSANGWAWSDEWVSAGRFRPVYIPAGVVTGRWASAGGGALQIPRGLRSAVRADPGWCLVVADVAQLEPRVLCGMSRDAALAEASRGRDLYEGIVADGAVATRYDAKLAMLGAMYGATTGESGRLMPRLRRTYPRAMAMVDAAARRGEDGAPVSTSWGRTTPDAGATWRATQARASEADASTADILRAKRASRDRGRFTRNFIVQGTAAEWALAWLADLRTRLTAFPEAATAAAASGPVFARRPHIAFFLHDEVIVHCPREHAEEVAEAVRDAAAAAGRLLFGDFPVDFPLDVRIAESAQKD